MVNKISLTNPNIINILNYLFLVQVTLQTHDIIVKRYISKYFELLCHHVNTKYMKILFEYNVMSALVKLSSSDDYEIQNSSSKALQILQTYQKRINGETINIENTEDVENLI